MSAKEDVRVFWALFCQTTDGLYVDAGYQVWYFGDTPEMARELADLVLARKKTATASLSELIEMVQVLPLVLLHPSQPPKSTPLEALAVSVTVEPVVNDAL